MIKGGLKQRSLFKKYDPRNFSYHKYGNLGAFDLSILPKEVYIISVEEAKNRVKNQGSSDMCLAFASTSVSEIQEGVILSPEYQFAKIKQIIGNIESWGADLSNGAKSFTKFGSIKQEETPFEF